MRTLVRQEAEPTQRRLPFPPCGGGLRRLSEQSELSRSWMGGSTAPAARARKSANCRGRSAASPPIPTFPHKGGRSSVACVARVIVLLPTRAPRRQRVQYLLALLRGRDDPVADLVDGAMAADAPPRGRVDLADADAGRRRAARQQTAALFPALLARDAALFFGDVVHQAMPDW